MADSFESLFLNKHNLYSRIIEKEPSYSVGKPWFKIEFILNATFQLFF